MNRRSFRMKMYSQRMFTTLMRVDFRLAVFKHLVSLSTFTLTHVFKPVQDIRSGLLLLSQFVRTEWLSSLESFLKGNNSTHLGLRHMRFLMDGYLPIIQRAGP